MAAIQMRPPIVAPTVQGGPIQQLSDDQRQAASTRGVLVRTHSLSNVLRTTGSNAAIVRRVVSPVTLRSLLVSHKQAGIGDGSRYGVIGLGTVHAERDKQLIPGLGGDLIVLGARAWLVDGNGMARQVPLDSFTPYALLAGFSPQKELSFDERLIGAAQFSIDNIVATTLSYGTGQIFDSAKLYAVKIICNDARLVLRCTKPSSRSSQSLNSLSREYQTSGAFALVGFHIPEVSAHHSQERAGWHWHALKMIPDKTNPKDTSKADGGHVISGALSNIESIQIQELTQDVTLFANNNEVMSSRVSFTRPKR